MKHETGNDAVLQWLAWSDVALQRTIVGCLHLLVVVVPEWIRQRLCEAVGVISSFVCETGQAATRLSIYGLRVAYMIARVSLVGLGWGLVLFSPVVIAVIAGANWCVWLSIVWSLVLMFGSLSAYLRWRALEDRARDEWRDKVVNGQTVREWIDTIAAKGVMPFERQTAILLLIESGTSGQMALMAALTADEAVVMNVIMKQWILAVVREQARSGTRFELTIENLYRTTRIEPLRRAAHSTLRKICSQSTHWRRIGKPTQPRSI